MHETLARIKANAWALIRWFTARVLRGRREAAELGARLLPLTES